MGMAPAVLALNGLSFTLSALLALATGFGIQILRHWDLRSGSALQLRLERRTYLIATLVTWCFFSEILGLLLFIYNADQLAPQFVGAMCATGVLNAAPGGWQTLFLKLLVSLLGAIWLLLNRLDNQAKDYPLIRVKYAFLAMIFPFSLWETLSQWRFFQGLHPDLITSCCGTLFTPAGRGVAAQVSSLDPGLSLIALGISGLLLFATGSYFLWKGRGAGYFSLSAGAAGAIALAVLVSSIALWVYENPHHHCPFCLLQSEYHYIGYGFYLSWFLGLSFALAASLVHRWRNVPSLAEVVPRESRFLAGIALAGFGVFYGLSAYAIFHSHLVLL